MMVRIAAPTIALVLLLCAGCAKQPGLTYAEAVQIYTNEAQELSRLQTERSRVQQSYEAGLKEGSKLDKELNLSKQDLDSLKSGSIDELINKATLELEYTQWYNERVKRGEQLKDAAAETEAINAKRAELGLPIEPGVAREAKAHEDAAKLVKERDEALAKLDKLIADQQVRVDRAKAVRDEIEARGR
jgi:hypothetical protein